MGQLSWPVNWTACGASWQKRTHSASTFTVCSTGVIWRAKAQACKGKGTGVQRYWPGGWFSIKMSSYQYRKSHCGDKTILRPSYLHNGISYTGKMTSLYWIRALVEQCCTILSQVYTYVQLSPNKLQKWVNINWFFLIPFIADFELVQSSSSLLI